eukprot:GHVS01077853.1.p1 GENE.GHVS01077853.1~~GHVS01077853.1.p1  ORF type:complete len:303 (+),score=64.46 GHVS01077853.1:410-1318(+)
MKYRLSLFLVVLFYICITKTTTTIATTTEEDDMVVIEDTAANNTTRRGRRIVGRIREGAVAVEALSAPPSAQGPQSSQPMKRTVSSDDEQNDVKNSETHGKQIFSIGVKMATGLLKSAKMFGAVGLPGLGSLDDATLTKQIAKIYHSKGNEEQQITKTTTNRPTTTTTTTITTTTSVTATTIATSPKASPFPCGGVQFKWSDDAFSVRTANAVSRVSLSLANQARCNDLSDARCLFGYKNPAEEIYFNSESDRWEASIPPQSTVVCISPTKDETNVYSTGSRDWTAIGGSAYIENIIAINCV